MRYEFTLDERLGIRIPLLHHEWEEYTGEERSAILLEWEEIRARIPDRIIALEKVINHRQAALYEEEDFIRSCELNQEIAELASTINDLNIWFRVEQDYDTRAHH
nr:hypothetical protein [Brevibacillus dissolubilis]